MLSMTTLVQFIALAAFAAAAPTNVTIAERAACIVNSVASSKSLSGCTTVTIQPFTVPAGQTVTIAAAQGAVVTMTGDVVFSKTTTPGPLFIINTPGVTFNGAGHRINVDILLSVGTNGGSFKPHPFVKLQGSGTFESFTVLNSPAQAISVGTTALSTIKGVTVDNTAGASLGHNTDGFDISASDVTVSGCTVHNQDDCVAVNSGNNVAFLNNICTGGHGISIGSIATGKSVTNFRAIGNHVSNSKYGIRIKVQQAATNAKVSGVTYQGNVLTGISDFGVLISQSYPVEDGPKVGTGGPISNVNFNGAATTVAVGSSALGLVVNCGACSGNWDFSSLAITGGTGHKIAANNAKITGGKF
ncbi:unnamed protein product [Mycena citricolor]|uniref:endo-polygalacturonase n=1 Tax=Mycena citricolor TaxID=2018698 RepID=A0AAD2JZF4_9AGAR|nr:unnamed protein product [Mycena citricolor]